MVPTLHTGLPTELHAPGLANCVREFVESADFAAICGEWSARFFSYNRSASFDVNNLFSNVIARPGPVLFFQPVKNADLAHFREKLNGRQVVTAVQAFEIVPVREAIVEVRRAHDNGEPHLPLDFVVALLVMRKLDRERMWMGHNKKGCMWAHDIPKGRGVDERFKHRVEPVLNMLLQEGLLDTKRSKGTNKYALHPEKKVQIMSILENRAFDGRLRELFNRSLETVSGRALDVLDDYKPDDRG